MDQERGNPEEEMGGYGTPTAEQESGGQQFAQPRPEEAIDEAGLEEERGEGGGYPGGAPDLSHLGNEDADSAGEPGAGRMGGIDDQAKAEQDSAEPDVLLPSAEAPMDEGNTDTLDYSPESDSAGSDAEADSTEPDGDATRLPDELSPRDDEEEGERFDAG
jgi:hypothetical protein